MKKDTCFTPEPTSTTKHFLTWLLIRWSGMLRFCITVGEGVSGEKHRSAKVFPSNIYIRFLRDAFCVAWQDAIVPYSQLKTSMWNYKNKEVIRCHASERVSDSQFAKFWNISGRWEAMYSPCSYIRFTPLYEISQRYVNAFWIHCHSHMFDITIPARSIKLGVKHFARTTQRAVGGSFME